MSPTPSARKPSTHLQNIDQNADLCSSLDSNNPRPNNPQSMSDASAENSSDDEKDAENGYVFLLSS